MMRMVGGLVGCSDKADALATRLAADLDRLREAAAEFTVRPRVFFEEWDDPLISGIQWVEELVEIAGGDPIFPELRHAKLGPQRVVSPDDVVRRDPEVIVASWCGKAVNKDRIASRPGWSGVTAIRNGNVYEIKSAYILQPGPASLTEGVTQLHEIFSRVTHAHRATPRPSVTSPSR
jgi:iron complex transport system substrate-binding protein